MINTNSSNHKSELLINIRFQRPSLTKTEKKVADYLLENPEQVLKMNLAEFAGASGSSQASILRFCKSLGVDGFPELKLQLSVALASETEAAPAQSEEVSPNDSISEIMEKVFWFNIQTLKDTLSLLKSAECENALSAIASSESVSLFGIGDAAGPCYFADIKLKRIGIRSQVHSDADMQLIMASMLGSKDVAIAISHSGRSRSVVEAMKIAKERGAKTICITKYQKSPLTKHCDICIYTATVDATVGKEIIARRVAEQAILEGLYLGLLSRKQPALWETLKRSTKVLEFNKI
jgi:DNA-binding MurR/RpiR family transcriptional regulator